MESITLKEFKERFYPKLTTTQFAETMHLSISLASKLINGNYLCSLKSKKWLELVEHIKVNYSLQLISEEAYSTRMEKLEKNILDLTLKVKEQEQAIADYEKVIEDLLSATRIMTGAKEAVEKGKFVLDMYRNRKKK